ncbi:hypothetical protein N7456_001844 [Penicillium angulare]|uniref:Uncharacterized protein n=1 Tax=Penicillium angulare TaxID=116970 RepID=A0A9W9KP86_9EURO|nr:hypothetical protein N7456_001844 [Penicillium angulare]
MDSFIHSTFENNVTARCENLPDPAIFSLPELKGKLAYEEDFKRWHSTVLATLRALGVEDIIYSVTFLFVFLPLSSFIREPLFFIANQIQILWHHAPNPFQILFRIHTYAKRRFGNRNMYFDSVAQNVQLLQLLNLLPTRNPLIVRPYLVEWLAQAQLFPPYWWMMNPHRRLRSHISDTYLADSHSKSICVAWRDLRL